MYLLDTRMLAHNLQTWTLYMVGPHGVLECTQIAMVQDKQMSSSLNLPRFMGNPSTKLLPAFPSDLINFFV